MTLEIRENIGLSSSGAVSRLSPLQRIWKSLLLFAAGIIPDVKEENRKKLFQCIMRDHDSLISRLCFGYSRTPEEFQDLRQDTYINIWQGLDSFNGTSSVKTWIYRITLNTCVSTLRKRRREVKGIDITDFSDIIDDSEEKIQMIKELHRAIDQLNPLDKAIVMMWLDEMSYDEIAEATGVGRNTLATKLRRAKEKLKHLI